MNRKSPPRTHGHQSTWKFAASPSSKPITIVAAAATLISMAVMLPSSAVSASGEKPAESEISVISDKIDIPSLIAGLSDESFIARKKATTELWSIGSDALPALRKAAQGSDPEAVDRAEELILYISAGVLFDSPEEVKQLVLKFSRAELDSKLKILTKLTELGQWKQVLHLARLASDPSVREKMSDIVHVTASRAAREALVEDDLDLAGEILQLSGNSDQAMVVRAWFYCRQGKLKQELAKAEAMPEKKGTLWRLALYRASGNLAGAIKEAKKAGQPKLTASMQVFAGDASPWLDLNTREGQQDEMLSLSSRIQQARLDGDTQQADQLARELTRLATDKNSSAGAIAGLAANGYHEEAITLLERYDVISAFDFHDSTESPQRALELLGIPKDAKPPYTEWVKSFTDDVIEKENEEDYNRLLLLAGFLVRHGEGEHADAVLAPLMTALEKDGSDAWFDLIATMPAFELGAQAIKLLENRGNDDGEIDLGVKKIFGSSKSTSHLWQAIKKRNENDINKSLHEISLLAGVIADPNKETDAIHQALLDEVVDKLASDKMERHEALFTFAIKRHEIGKASKMVNDFADANGRWKRTKIFLDTALLRWKKVEPSYAELEKENPGDFSNLTKWAMVLRKLGQKEKARKVLDRALLLTLGDSQALSTIAIELAQAGYDKEAIALWEKIAIISQPGSSDYDRAILFFCSGIQPTKNGGSWKQAAAVAEVYARFTMRGRSNGNILAVLDARFKADFFQGMHLLKNGKRQRALIKLNACQSLTPGSASLADDFFPTLRKAGIDKQYKQWFEKTYQHVEAACQLYPKSANTHNTAAWLAARAVRRLDDALRHSKAALALRPKQGAYIDTMAEVWFSKGNRKKAIEWSNIAIAASISHAQGAARSESRVLSGYNELNKQLHHFKHDPMP